MRQAGARLPSFAALATREGLALSSDGPFSLPESGYAASMTIEELTPEAVALLKSLVNNPHPITDSPLLQLLMADRLVMGSPNKVHATQSGLRLLGQYEAARLN